MPTSIDVNALYNDYTKNVQDYKTAQKTSIDKITKLLQDNVVSPTAMVDMVSQVSNPVTPFEVMRGERRPSPGQIMEAAKASEIKNNIGLTDILSKGVDQTAHEMQLAINAINAQAAQNNTQAMPIKNVMNSVMTGLDPTSQVLFAQEFLGRMGSQFSDNATDENAWSTASNVIKDLGLKGKDIIPKPVTYYTPDGEQVDIFYNPMTKEIEAKTGIKKPAGSGRLANSQMLYKTVTTTDPDTGQVITTREPVGQYVPGIGTGGQVQGLPAGLSGPGAVTVTPPGTKTVTPPKPLSVGDSATLASTKSGIGLVEDVQNKIFPNGKFDRSIVTSMANRLPWTQGRTLSDEMIQSVIDYTFAKSGKAVTDAEREQFRQIFIPSTFDSEEQIKAKLARMKQFFEGSVEFLPQYLKNKFFDTTQSSDNENPALTAARQAVANGKSKTAVIQRLKENGIDWNGE